MSKIAFVTTLQPETHYSRYLIGALEDQLRGKTSLLIYADKDPQNKQLAYPNLRLVWTPTFLFPFQIARQVIHDRPTIVHIQHEINMYGGPSTAALFPLLLLSLWLIRIKTVVTVHSVVSIDQVDTEFMRTFSWRPSWFLIRAVRLFFSILYRSIGWFAAHVIVHSQYMADLLNSNYGVSSAKVTSIPIGVPKAKLDPDKEIVLDQPWSSGLDRKKFVLYFGYIIRRKGLEYLIDAFQSIHSDCPGCVLILAGGELDYQREYARRLRQQVKDRGLGQAIIFTSFISGGEIEKLFARCEFVVLPYTYSISSSLPLSFAMQYGKPVIATRLGTLTEEIEEGATGLLVPSRDAAALSEAMRRLITDQTLLRRLGEGAREKGRRRSWGAAADRTIEVYRSVGSGISE